MEAASARYAARDRFAATEPAQTPLQRYIQNAVDPQNYEPNLALDLEIADLINSKKGNAPREAAVAIVNYVNHRNANVSLLALTLLDICVKNCGYPFHLQISTKEFLNELVRRFPERPPIRPSRVQLKVLEAIEEWRQTICQTSRYKEDLGFIRDMHRLLSYKGYIFPEVRREDAAVLNPSDNLQSADEMEEEEKAAQSAKLQELIRRGGPEDLQEANRLMKVMAGYDTKHKTDYRAKAAEEVGKIQQKAKLLEERLQNFKAGDEIGEGDIFEELAGALQSAQPKIQKMCEEESDDSEAVGKLLEINDSIHRTIERYKLVKKGDIDAALKIPQGTLGTSTGVRKTADNELSLIDFSGDETPGGDTIADGPSAQKESSLQDDLLGLSIQDQGYGQSGGIALGFGANTNIPGPSLLSSQTQQSSAKETASNATPQPAQNPPAPKPNYDPFSSLSSSHPSSRSATPGAPSLLQQQNTTKATQPSSDPFAALSSPAPRQPSPFLPTQSTQPPAPSSSASLLNFPSTKQTPPQSHAGPKTFHASNAVPTDDDWNFASALPDDATNLPTANNLIVSNTTVQIAFQISRTDASDSVISIQALFSNNSPSLVTEYTFQVAVTKGFTLKLTPQSGRTLQPQEKNGITQPIAVHGVSKGQTASLKMRWKASYKVAGDLRNEQGEVPPLEVLLTLGTRDSPWTSCRRSIFELYAGREPPLIPADLPLETLRPPPSYNVRSTTSEELIDALGPVGQDYKRPKKYEWLVDLSYAAPWDVISDRKGAIEEAKQAREAQRLSLREGKYPKARKEILISYLHHVHSVIEYNGQFENSNAKDAQLDIGLLKVFNNETCEYLLHKGLDVTDVMNWAWILTANTSERAALRLTLVANKWFQDRRRSLTVPQFIFTFLLRRVSIDARALGLLLDHASRLLEASETSMAVLPKAGNCNPLGEQPLKKINIVLNTSNGLAEHVFIVLIIRLLRRARAVWPAAFEKVIELFNRYMNGLNFQRTFSSQSTLTPDDIHRLTYSYNTMLRLLALPSSLHPFQNMAYQQRAQFALLKRMGEFDPPLTVDKRGYQAIMRVQLMHRKTQMEREWAHLKAPSWPPYKQDKLGTHASIGVEEYGLSRAYQVLCKAREAGYADDRWDDAAKIFSGWDPVGTPTIQTRTIATYPANNPNRIQASGQGSVWAARMKSTRTLDEAWSCFLSWKCSSAESHTSQEVYLEMFKKLVYKKYSRSAEMKQPTMNDKFSEQPLPGDNLDVLPSPESPFEALYVPRPPPSIDELFEMMREDHIKPAGRLLSFLISQASSIGAGIKYLKVSQLPQRQIDALLSDDLSGNLELLDALDEVSDDLFAGFIELLARFVPTRSDKDGANQYLFVKSQSTPGSGRWMSKTDIEDHTPLNHDLLDNPLLKACELLLGRTKRYKPAWYTVFRALAGPKSIVDTSLRSPSQNYQDVESWGMLSRLLDQMRAVGLRLDMDGFYIMCIALEKAIFASERQLGFNADSRDQTERGLKRFEQQRATECSQEVLSTGLSRIQLLFKDIVRVREMYQVVPKTIAAEGEQDKRTSNEDIPDPEDEESLHDQQKALISPACLLPKLPEVPHPAHLHAFIRVLGLRRDYCGILDLVEWMSQFADELEAKIDQPLNGRRMMRRCIIAIRVFFERSWIHIRRNDGHSRAGREGIMIEAPAAPAELLKDVIAVVASEKRWGGWATEQEVVEYVHRGRFL